MPEPLQGDRSTLFLVLSYRFAAPQGVVELDAIEASLKEVPRFPQPEGTKPWDPQWSRRALDDTALLPHLDEQTRRGELLRAFRFQGPAATLFDRTWRFTDAAAKKSVDAVFTGPPMLFVFESGYAFVSVPVRPVNATLTDLTDLRAALTRRGFVHLVEPEPSRDRGGERWRALCAQRAFEGFTLREAMASLVPGLPSTPPPAGRQNPKALAVVFTEVPLEREAGYRLRLAQHAQQEFGGVAEPETFAPSSREQCSSSSFGLTWVVQPQGSQFLSRFDETFRDRYLYKWLLAEHQRLYLLWLSSRSAALAAELAPREFRTLRHALLHHVARYQFKHLSDEERHDEFYRWLRERMDLNGLLEEVKAEIMEIDEYLEARRGDTLNKFLAFLTIVLTPVGLVIGVFQENTLPPIPDGFSHWGALAGVGLGGLLRHPPFILFLAVAGVGFGIFSYVGRLLDRPAGANAAARLSRRLRS